MAILIAITCLSQTFCTTEERYDEIYKSFSARHSKEDIIQLFNSLLDEPEIFNKREHPSTTQLLARKYFTANFLELSKENLETVIKANSDAFKKTLFGKSLILGWALHNGKGNYDLRELFNIKADKQYGDFYRQALENAELAVEDDVVIHLNILNEQEHCNFYFETIHLAWPSKDLKAEQLLANERALKLKEEQQLKEEEDKRQRVLQEKVLCVFWLR